jgi:hypothetical protein
LISTRSTIHVAEEIVSVMFTMADKGFFNNLWRIAYAGQFILFRLEWIPEFPEVPAWAQDSGKSLGAFGTYDAAAISAASFESKVTVVILATDISTPSIVIKEN